MQIDDVIRKINKLLAIAADPSASDQEIQLATYRAEKLMLKYKIENKDIINEKNSNKDVIKVYFDDRYTGYTIWTLNYIAKYCQTKALYNGKVNSTVKLGLIGFEDDIKFAESIALPVIKYMEETLKDLKECYIGDVDFRVYKRSWCQGFAEGIELQLKNSLLEMKNNKKIELSIIDLHPAIIEYANNNLELKHTRSNYSSRDAYDLGVNMGSKYTFDKNTKTIEKGADN